MSQGFSIGPLVIHYYGVLIMLGAMAAAWLSDREARRRNKNPEIVWDSLPWVLVAGIIGARLWHILTPPDSMVAQGITFQYYLTHPLDALAIWRGGLGIPGAVMGGALALYIYLRRKKESFAVWSDIIAPGLVLAQAVGRWGNFINQELYGKPTNLPWAIFIEPRFRLAAYQEIAYYHPTFLYESLWNLMTMGLLLWAARRFSSRLFPGDIFLMYLVLYPVARFVLEYIRIDFSSVGALNINQTLMGIIGLSSIGFFIWRHWSRKPALGDPAR